MNREYIQSCVSSVVRHAAEEHTFNTVVCNMTYDELYKHTMVDIQLLTEFIMAEIKQAKKECLQDFINYIIDDIKED